MDLEAEDATFGVRTVADLSLEGPARRVHLHRVRALPAGVPGPRHGEAAQPQGADHGHPRHEVEAAEAGLPLIPNSPSVRGTFGLDDTLKPEAVARPIVDAAIPYDAVWDCVTCGACVEACPVTIEHVDKIVGLRRNLVLEDSRFPQEITAAFRGMESVGNPWGQPPSSRLDWAKGLPFKVRTVAEVKAAGAMDELEVLYWVGCAAAFDDRNRRVARAVVTCLEAAGVSYAVLGQEESCTGDPARRMGNEYVFQILAGQNIDDAQPVRDGGADDRHRLPPLLQHASATSTGSWAAHFTIRHHSQFLADAGRGRGGCVLDADGLPGRRSRTTTPATSPATTG